MGIATAIVHCITGMVLSIKYQRMKKRVTGNSYNDASPIMCRILKTSHRISLFEGSPTKLYALSKKILRVSVATKLKKEFKKWSYKKVFKRGNWKILRDGVVRKILKMTICYEINVRNSAESNKRDYSWRA